MEGAFDAKGRRLYSAITEVVAGGELTVEEVARRVGCTPREVLDVLLRYDRASRISITPAGDDAEVKLLVRSLG